MKIKFSKSFNSIEEYEEVKIKKKVFGLKSFQHFYMVFTDIGFIFRLSFIVNTMRNFFIFFLLKGKINKFVTVQEIMMFVFYITAFITFQIFKLNLESSFKILMKFYSHLIFIIHNLDLFVGKKKIWNSRYEINLYPILFFIILQSSVQLNKRIYKKKRTLTQSNFRFNKIIQFPSVYPYFVVQGWIGYCLGALGRDSN